MNTVTDRLVGETVAEGVEDLHRRELAEQPGDDARDRDDEEGVQPEREADDDEQNADEYEHDRPPSRVGD